MPANHPLTEAGPPQGWPQNSSVKSIKSLEVGIDMSIFLLTFLQNCCYDQLKSMCNRKIYLLVSLKTTSESLEDL